MARPSPLTIADLPVWEIEPPQRVTAELTPREAELINRLRSIPSDAAYVAVVDMVVAMAEFHNRQHSAGV